VEESGGFLVLMAAVLGLRMLLGRPSVLGAQFCELYCQCSSAASRSLQGYSSTCVVAY
jgi:hypothetical protein